MKRGDSGLCLVVGVDKPAGLSSHDVVNRCRGIFGERRCGHLGTLDPLATGVLPVCIGPATRLDAFMEADSKAYEATVAFGTSTDTDDAEGAVINQGPVPEEVFDPFFATSFVEHLVGKHQQLPPVYSALKKNGVKAYEAARRGHVIDLSPRSIEIYETKLLGIHGIDGFEAPAWTIRVAVSKGTYIRALARDMGNALGCPAHLQALRRLRVGNLGIEECVSLESLEALGVRAALDPVRLLGLRFAFADSSQKPVLENGGVIPAAEVKLYEPLPASSMDDLCACTAGICPSVREPGEGECFSFILDNELKAIYNYDEHRRVFKPRCVFQKGVDRGQGL